MARRKLVCSRHREFDRTWLTSQLSGCAYLATNEACRHVVKIGDCSTDYRRRMNEISQGTGLRWEAYAVWCCERRGHALDIANKVRVIAAERGCEALVTGTTKRRLKDYLYRDKLGPGVVVKWFNIAIRCLDLEKKICRVK